MAQATQQATEATWQARMVEELTRDKKKTTILAVLLLVGVVFGLRTMKKSVPAQASAISTADMTDMPFLMEEPGQPASLRGRGYPAETEVYVPEEHVIITRDLFTFDPTGFEVIEKPVPIQEDPAVPVVAAGQDQVAAMMAIRQAAAELQLQSTMASDNPVAIIDGQVLTIGETIDGFTVTSISAESCVVTKQGVNVSLMMGGGPPQE